MSSLLSTTNSFQTWHTEWWQLALPYPDGPGRVRPVALGEVLEELHGPIELYRSLGPFVPPTSPLARMLQLPESTSRCQHLRQDTLGGQDQRNQERLWGSRAKRHLVRIDRERTMSVLSRFEPFFRPRLRNLDLPLHQRC